MTTYSSPRAFSPTMSRRPMVPSLPPQRSSPTADLIRRAQQPITRQDRVQTASDLGYRISGDEAIGSLGRFTTTTPLSMFSPSRPFGNLDPSLLNALLNDTEAMQGAADRQFARNQAGIDQMGAWLSALRPDLLGQTQQAVSPLAALGDRAVGLGDAAYNSITRGVPEAMDSARGGIESLLRTDLPAARRTLDSAEQDVNAGYVRGDQSVATMQSAVRDYADMTAEQVSAMTSGLRQQARTAMEQVKAGIHPDGTPMTAQEQNDAMTQIKMSVADQVQTQATAIYSNFNTTQAQLRTTLAQIQKANADLRLQGAATKGQLASTRGSWTQLGIEGNKAIGDLAAQGAAIDAEARRTQQSFMQLGASIRETTASLQQAAMFQAVNLELNGQTQLAQLVQQNPESVVSWFQGLLALFSTQAAAGGGGGGGLPSRPSQPTQTGGGIRGAGLGGSAPWNAGSATAGGGLFNGQDPFRQGVDSRGNPHSLAPTY